MSASTLGGRRACRVLWILKSFLKAHEGLHFATKPAALIRSSLIMQRLYEEQRSASVVAGRRKGLQEEEGNEVDASWTSPVSRLSRDTTRTEVITVHSAMGSLENHEWMDASVSYDNDAVLYESQQHFPSDVERAEAPASHNVGAQPVAPSSINLNIPQVDPDLDFSIEDNATLVSDITDMHVVEAFTRAEMAEQLRQQMRSEMQRELANVVTAEVIEPDPPVFWTKRRVIMSVSLVLIVVVGLVVGVVVAIGAKSPNEEEYLEGVTINGTRSNDDRFGENVVLSRDASTIASAAKEGHYVQVFRRDQSNLEEPAWNQLGQTLYFEHQKDAKFEGRLDLNKDGSVLAVGQWNNDDAGTNAGYAVIYWYNGSMWTQLGEPLLGNAPRDAFVSFAF